MKINAGSGQRPFGKGWVNVDIQPRWEQVALDAGGEFICADMSSLMFNRNTVDVIVSHHTIEHLGCSEATPFVKEAYRLLRPGGSFIITVPDMSALVSAWMNGQMPNGDPMTDYLFFVNVYGAYMDSDHDRHKWGYTPWTLKKMISDAAEWRNVLLFDWREIEGADIAQDWWIMGVEAVK